MMNQDDNELDDFFREGLGGYTPPLDDAIWKNLQEGLQFDARYHNIDDTFHDGLKNYEAIPPDEAWPKIKEHIDTSSEMVLSNELGQLQATPPDWIWESLKYLLYQDNRRRKIRRGIVASFAGIMMLGTSIALYVSVPFAPSNNFSENNTLTNTDPSANPPIAMEAKQPRALFSAITPNQEMKQSPRSVANVSIQNQDKTNNSLTSEVVNFENTTTSSNNLISFTSKSNSFANAGQEQANENTQYLENIFELSQKATLFAASPNSLPEARRHKIPSGPKSLSPFSISISGAKDISYRVISASNNSDYLNIRNKSENNLKAFTLAARLNYKLRRWKLSTGMVYTRRGEVANYNFKTSIESHTAIQFYDPASKTYFSAPYSHTDTYEHQKTSTNTYEYIEVPLKVSYQLNRNRLSVAPALSINSGYLFSAKGTTITVSQNPNNIELSQISLSDLRRSSMSTVLSLELLLQLDRRTSLLIEPYYSKLITNTIANSGDVTQKYYNKGVMLGLDYRF